MDGPVLIDQEVVVAVHGGSDARAPPVPPRRDVAGLEPDAADRVDGSPLGPERIQRSLIEQEVAEPTVLVQVLADETGEVASISKPGGEGVGVIEEAYAPVVENVGENSVIVGVLPGQERCARGAAQRGGYE